MKANKKNDLEALAWFVALAQDWPPLDTSKKQWAFYRKLHDFLIRHAPDQVTDYTYGFIPGENRRMASGSRRDWTEYLKDEITRMIFAVPKHERIALPWPEWRALVWNNLQGYLDTPDYSKDTVEKVTLRLLIDLLRRHWRLLKRCEAYVSGSYVAKCGKLFVAERTTGAYCSDTCKYRMFKRHRRRTVAREKRKGKTN